MVLVRRARVTRFQLPGTGPYRMVKYADEERRTVWLESPTNGKQYKLNVANVIPLKVAW